MNLSELVAAARPGATLRLPAGRVAIRGPLVLDKPLTLKGAGPSRTVIAGALICAAPKLRLERLGVERRDKAPGHVVVVRSGRVELLDVHVRGGRGKKGDDDMGAGVRLEGGAEAMMLRCLVEGNAAAAVNVLGRARLRAEDVECRKSQNGIEVAGDASAELHRCRVEDCEYVAVGFSDRARGSAKHCMSRGCRNGFAAQGEARVRFQENEAADSRWPLLYAGDRSEVHVVGNVFSKTRAAGIFVEGAATARIMGNRVTGAGSSGIEIHGRAKVVASRNVVEGAGELGIFVGGSARAELADNKLRGNGWSGIGVGGGTVVAVRNACLDNREYGLVVFNAARPALKANVARGNAMGGLWARGTSAPRVEDGVFEENMDVGLRIAEKARGTYVRNRCRKNESAGISVENEAAPGLLHNLVEAHEDYGIRYSDRAAGLAKGNVCARNAYGVGVLDEARPRLTRNTVTRNSDEGIKVLDHARPAIVENAIEANGGGGIEFGDRSGGVARGNRCVGNLYGIECWGGVTPRLERNECLDNEGKGISQDADRKGVKPRVTMVANESRGNGEEDGIGRRLPAARLRRLLGGTPAAALVRAAWKPGTEEGEGLSKFGGVPHLDPGESWPRCGSCRKPLPLLLQLDLSLLPKPFRGKGLVQAFCCRFDRSSCQDAEGSSLVRVRPPQGVAARPAGKPWPARRIVGWRESGELPRWMELRPRSLAKTVAARGLNYFDGDDELGEGPSADPQAGDKLGGWADWVVQADTPRCSRCRRDMRLLFQIGSEDNVPFEWGDSGAAWIFRCDAHPEALKLDWQCL